MTYLQNGYLTFGYEFEGTGISLNTAQQLARDNNLKHIIVKQDGTAGVDFEINFPNYPLCTEAYNDIKFVLELYQANGAKVTKACGGHVHISNRKVMGISKSDFFHNSKNHMLTAVRDQFSFRDNFHEGKTFYNGGHYDDQMPNALAIDFFRRYSAHQDIMNSIQPKSRTNHSMARSLSSYAERINNSTSISDLVRMGLDYKYLAVTLKHYNTHGTIEIRQNTSNIEIDKLWMFLKLMFNMFETSDSQRLDYSRSLQTHNTPVQPYSNGTRLATIWNMCRSENGATVQEMQIATGTSRQNIAGRISEMRSRFGDQAIVTSTQQANGHSYGSGDNYCSYKILESFTTGTTEPVLKRANQIPTTSPWLNVSDSLFEQWQDRIEHLKTSARS